MCTFSSNFHTKLSEIPRLSQYFLAITAVILATISLDFALFANSLNFLAFVLTFAAFSIFLAFFSEKCKFLHKFPAKSLFSWLLLAVFAEISSFRDFPWLFLETYQILASECEVFAKTAGFLAFPLQNLYFLLRFSTNDREKLWHLCSFLLSVAYFCIKTATLCGEARKTAETQQEIAVLRATQSIFLREVRDQGVILLEKSRTPAKISLKPAIFLHKFLRNAKKTAEKSASLTEIRVKEQNEVAREELGDNFSAFLQNVEILRTEDESTAVFCDLLRKRSISPKSPLKPPPVLQKPGHLAEILRESFCESSQKTAKAAKTPEKTALKRTFTVLLRNCSKPAILRVFSVSSRVLLLFLERLSASKPLESVENNEKPANSLKETEKLLQELQLKDKLLASVTHDMRSPLNGLIYFLRNARESSNEALKNQRIEYSLINAQMLTFLVNDLLAFSQKNPQTSLNLSKFLLQETVESVCDCLKFEAESKGVRLFIENCCRKQLMLINDEFRLKQVLINLLTNALKFTLRGFVKVKLTQICEIDDNLVKVEVIDTGLGISKEVLPKLMQPYCTFDNKSVKVNKNGIGLGLFICKSIVQFLGPNDELFIYSEEDKGTKIGFLLYIVNETGEKRSKSHGNSPQLKKISESSEKCEENKTEKILSNWDNMSGKSERVSKISAENSIFERNIESYHEENFLDSEFRETAIKRRNISDKSFYNKKSLMSHRSTTSYTGSLYHNNKKSLIKRINAQISSLKMISSPRTFTTFRYSRNFNVLIVDDHAFNLLMLQEILTGFVEWSLFIDKASNGKMAFEMFCEKNAQNSNEFEAYQLIFMDCEMPFMDGVEATRLIRDKICKEGFRDVRIVGCTGDYEKFKRENSCEGLILGMDEWHGKPISKEIIGNCLRKFLV